MSEETSIADVAAVAGDSQQTDDVSRGTLPDPEVKTQENQELNDDGTPKEAAKATEKTEKTEAERERARMQRGIDRKTRQAAEARAQAEQLRRENEELRRQLTPRPIGVNSQSESDDSDRLTFTKAEAAKFIEEEARKLAPTIAKQLTTEEQIRSAAQSLKQELGEEEFDELTDELGDVLPAEKQLALLSSKNPAQLVRYLADPDNAVEAKSIAAMSDFQAGMAIAAIEAKLAAKPLKPEVSKAAEPLRPVKQSGPANDPLPKDSDPPDVWYQKEYARVNKLRGTAQT
jgi:hypothetical protein